MKIYSKIVLPLIYPYFFSGLRLAFARSWRTIIVAEFFVSISGMGFMLGVAKDTYNVERMLAWTAIILMILVFFNHGLFDYIDRKTMRRWKQEP